MAERGARAPRPATVLGHSGDLLVVAAALGGGVVALGDAAPSVLRASLVAAVAASAAALPVKLAVRRPRPDRRGGAIVRALDPYSFPSGHAARTAAIAATALAQGNGWWPAAVGVWAVVVAWARVRLGFHDAFDIAGGWVLGALAAFVVMQA